MDWTNAAEQVTEHFTVKDCLFLHSWNRLATADDGVDFDKLLTLCQKLEEIRSALGCAMNVHCMFRSQEYNAAQDIKPAADVHSMCLAADFDCNHTMSIADVQAKLEPLLEDLGIRMERNTETWIHIDLRAPGPSGRYFTA
jgi:Peptidase M15